VGQAMQYSHQNQQGESNGKIGSKMNILKEKI
jgi:hypothetical protein